MSTRREFMTLLGGAGAAWPLAPRAQQPSAELPRICSIHTTRSENSDRFFRALRDAGFFDGQNVRIDTRSGRALLRHPREYAARCGCLVNKRRLLSSPRLSEGGPPRGLRHSRPSGDSDSFFLDSCG
jgi:hypothetical protein